MHGTNRCAWPNRTSCNFMSALPAICCMLGVNLVLRKLGSTAKPVTEIDEKDGNWRITTKTTFKTTEIKFRLGVPFEEETADGRKCQVIIICHENLINNDAVGSV
ncbi:unnamed protein product [Allacma fusca]|uniref:Lipocalin/cytosolic fatty-acid binding domain-containing protein n=1 Tax=Allacma fusca TaxID=39272 RepID=A0A8J2L1G5_9HEXA|nr:unnamed protein product [Allacma fusca]